MKANEMINQNRESLRPLDEREPAARQQLNFKDELAFAPPTMTNLNDRRK